MSAGRVSSDILPLRCLRHGVDPEISVIWWGYFNVWHASSLDLVANVFFLNIFIYDFCPLFKIPHTTLIAKNAAIPECTKRCFGVAVKISEYRLFYRSDRRWPPTYNQAILNPETLHQNTTWKSMQLYLDGRRLSLTNRTSVKAAVQTQLSSNRSQQWAALPWIRDKRFTVNSKWCFLQPIDHSRPLGFHPRSAVHPSSHSFPDDTV